MKYAWRNRKETKMPKQIDSQVSTVMGNAKTVARKEFGQDYVAAHPEIIAAMFQGIAALAQAKAMEQLGKDICAAAAHRQGRITNRSQQQRRQHERTDRCREETRHCAADDNDST
jgi:hypothetical protein